MFTNKRIIVLCPHVDDGECGVGGTIVKAIDEGAEVYYVSFSYAEKSLPFGYCLEDIKKECSNSCDVLGVSESINYNYEVRELPKYRQEILENMVKLSKDINPHIVFTPSTHDTHQDHAVICEESFRAFKKCSILGYEVLRNNKTFNGLFFVELNLIHVGTKIKALKCYESQTIKNHGDLEFFKSLARMRGAQIYKAYAECFEVIRIINNLK